MVAFEGTTLASFGGATSGAQALQWMTANHKLTTM